MNIYRALATCTLVTLMVLGYGGSSLAQMILLNRIFLP